MEWLHSNKETHGLDTTSLTKMLTNSTEQQRSARAMTPSLTVPIDAEYKLLPFDDLHRLNSTTALQRTISQALNPRLHLGIPFRTHHVVQHYLPHLRHHTRHWPWTRLFSSHSCRHNHLRWCSRSKRKGYVPSSTLLWRRH